MTQRMSHGRRRTDVVKLQVMCACGEKFDFRPGKKYCSDRCMQNAYKRRVRAKAKANV